jgi:heptosyltransferase I
MRIAIVKLSALGDIVHAMVVLQFIKKFNNKISIDWIVEESYKDLLEFHPDLNKVHLVNLKDAKRKRSVFALFRELKKVHKLSPYDLVVDMQGLLKSALIARLIPSVITLGFDKFSAREKVASTLYNKTFHFEYDKNVVERNLALIEFSLGLIISEHDIKNKSPFLKSNEEHLENNLSKIKKNIILVPGASHKSKCIPIHKLVELAYLIDANFLIVWGNAKEKKMADDIKALAPFVNVCDQLSISLLISLISSADLLIGPDTGPTHMAWALNIPSISLFGSTPGYRNTYPTSINQVIESNSIVNPRKINKNDDSIKEIEVKDIVKVASELLK